MSSSQPLIGSSGSSIRRPLAAVAAIAAVCLLGVAFNDLTAKGNQATELAAFYIPARGEMLYDAALEPLYTEGEPIEPYTWTDTNGDFHNPELNNVYADLPMKREEIMDPDDEFRGMAPKDMSMSCDKTDSCEPPINVLDYLPETEAFTMANPKNGGVPVEPENVWDDITLEY